VIAGRIAADAVRVVWGALVLVGFGVLLGFRFGGGVGGALGGLVLVTAFGVTMCWPMAFIGLAAKSPEAVNTWGFMIILPLTFASSAFARPETMPGWLEAFAEVNPITQVIDATRGLMLGGPVADPVLRSVLWMVAIAAVFAPLAISRFRRRI
jgi:ABC transporter DrrB family efflux protein